MHTYIHTCIHIYAKDVCIPRLTPVSILCSEDGPSRIYSLAKASSWLTPYGKTDIQNITIPPRSCSHQSIQACEVRKLVGGVRNWGMCRVSEGGERDERREKGEKGETGEDGAGRMSGNSVRRGERG